LIYPYYNGNLIKEIVRQTFSALTRKSGSAVSGRVYTVQILNGTTRTGMAARTAELLSSFGYDTSTGNADRNDYESTEIINRQNDKTETKALSDIIHCKNIRNEPLTPEETDTEVFHSDFTLIIGKDFNGRYATGK
jgi:hypothetical protein